VPVRRASRADEIAGECSGRGGIVPVALLARCARQAGTEAGATQMYDN
jgi:hypothetical protein